MNCLYCNNKLLSRGLCSTHYFRWRNSKPMEAIVNFQRHHKGEIKTAEYRAWRGMLSRCNTKSASSYRHYGGRDIKVCARWEHNYENFLEDLGRKPSPTYSLDRINNDGNENRSLRTFVRRNWPVFGADPITNLSAVSVSQRTIVSGRSGGVTVIRCPINLASLWAHYEHAYCTARSLTNPESLSPLNSGARGCIGPLHYACL